MIQIKAKDIRLVNVSEIQRHPKNPKSHPQDQIDRLAFIIQTLGFTKPLIISNNTGYLLAGHGALEAAIKAGMKAVPCMFQDFDDEDEEFAVLTSDNAIGMWGEIDLGMVNASLGDLSPDFNIDLLGVKNFTVDVNDRAPSQGSKELKEIEFSSFSHKCPRCKFEFNGD